MISEGVNVSATKKRGQTESFLIFEHGTKCVPRKRPVLPQVSQSFEIAENSVSAVCSAPALGAERRPQDPPSQPEGGAPAQNAPRAPYELHRLGDLLGVGLVPRVKSDVLAHAQQPRC